MLLTIVIAESERVIDNEQDSISVVILFLQN